MDAFVDKLNIKILAALALTALALAFITAGVVAITISGGASFQHINVMKTTNPETKTKGFGEGSGAGARCSELIPVQEQLMSQFTGPWILLEKLEFPDGMSHHNQVPNRDQTAICLRTEFLDTSAREASLHTSFYLRSKLTKNFTGAAKMKDNKHWDFHMLAKDHDGVVVEHERGKYFVFVECVTSPKANKGQEFDTPASVYVYSRGKTADLDLNNLRRKIEILLKHSDENLLDFGEYCYG